MNNKDALCIIYRNLTNWSGDLKDIKFNISGRDIYAEDGVGMISIFDDATDKLICILYEDGFFSSCDADWLAESYEGW